MCKRILLSVACVAVSEEMPYVLGGEVKYFLQVNRVCWKMPSVCPL